MRPGFTISMITTGLTATRSTANGSPVTRATSHAARSTAAAARPWNANLVANSCVPVTAVMPAASHVNIGPYTERV